MILPHPTGELNQPELHPIVDIFMRLTYVEGEGARNK